MKNNLHTTKCTSLFHEFPNKDGYLQPSEESKEFDKMSFKQKLAFEANLWKEAVTESVDNIKEKVLTGPRIFLIEHQLEPVWRFTGDPEELKKWVVTSDKDNNIGYSTGQ